MPDLLLEIGTEDLPASFVRPASEQLRQAMADALHEERLAAASLRAWATPRRLAVLATSLPPQQPDAQREVKGPPARAAYGEDGTPTQAALGFARSVGVPVEALERRHTEGGEYVFARIHLPGKPAAEVLPAILPGVVYKISFPKTMRWADKELRFARPIRWIVALLDQEVVPFEIAGVPSGRSTRGHRILSPGPHVVERADAYEQTLQRHFVIADADVRAERIRRDALAAAAAVGGAAEVAPSLLDEVTFLVEYPTVFVGRFDPSYLSLPPEVLVTVMQHHQRYFPVRGASGLLAHFVGVRDGDELDIDTVREGNEWVLDARLHDAQFFYREDRKVHLADRLGRLRDLAFHQDLGSMYEKTERVAALADWLAERAGCDRGSREHLQRAAWLSKADLVTRLVGEFPELQGTVGGVYARLDGEPEPVAAAIAEHYRPRGADDEPPSNLLGALLGIADRADTLAGLLSLGLAPTGSSDPHGLRRVASGLLDILKHYRRQIQLNVADLLKQALARYSRIDFGVQAEARILEFLDDRIRAWLLDHGFAHDVVNAVLSIAGAGPSPDFLKALARAEALTQFRRLPEFAAAYEAFDRAYRIWDQQTTTYVPPLAHPAEQALEQALDEVHEKVTQSIQSEDYLQALRALARLRDPVAVLFDQVLVNDPDALIRGRRHALLGRVVNLFMPVANFFYLVVPGAGTTREAGTAKGTQ